MLENSAHPSSKDYYRPPETKFSLKQTSLVHNVLARVCSPRLRQCPLPSVHLLNSKPGSRSRLVCLNFQAVHVDEVVF